MADGKATSLGGSGSWSVASKPAAQQCTAATSTVRAAFVLMCNRKWKNGIELFYTAF